MPRWLFTISYPTRARGTIVNYKQNCLHLDKHAECVARVARARVHLHVQYVFAYIRACNACAARIGVLCLFACFFIWKNNNIKLEILNFL